MEGVAAVSDHPEHDPEAARALIRAIFLEGNVVAHPDANVEVKDFAHREQKRVLRLRKMHDIRDTRHVLDSDALLDALSRPMYLGRPRPITDSQKKRGRPPKRTRTQYDEWAERRQPLRALHHKAVRLPEARKKALMTRFEAGKEYRIAVYGICLELRKKDTPKRDYRSGVKHLAAIRGLRIPGETRLTALISEFFKAVANYST